MGCRNGEGERATHFFFSEREREVYCGCDLVVRQSNLLYYIHCSFNHIYKGKPERRGGGPRFPWHAARDIVPRGEINECGWCIGYTMYMCGHINWIYSRPSFCLCGKMPTDCCQFRSLYRYPRYIGLHRRGWRETWVMGRKPAEEWLGKA